MTYESYCAEILSVTERETFISIGDGQVAQYLNPTYHADARVGKALSLPDLLSTSRVQDKLCYRLREVKYKLEERLVLKAVDQLRTGCSQVRNLYPDSVVDRLEIVIPLKDRKLKRGEFHFLGSSLDSNRFLLKTRDREVVHLDESNEVPITVLIL